MKNNSLKASVSLLTILALITACQPQNSLYPQANIMIIDKKVSRTQIKGKAEFPQPKGLQTKASLNEVNTQATVSIIYPPDHPTLANKAVATGLTDNSGVFVINLDSSFTPLLDEIFILEASKRLGRTNQENLSVSTYIKWNGTDWDSITSTNVLINTKTTAISIIANFNTSTITAGDTINKIINGTPQDINSNVNAQTVLDVAALVNTVLTNNLDPIRYIGFQNGNYLIINPQLEPGLAAPPYTSTLDTITLNWNKAPGATGYRVYKNGTQIQVINSGDTLTYTDINLPTATNFTYKVSSVYNGSESLAFLTINASTLTLGNPGQATTPFSAASDSLILNWTEASNAGGYKIFRDNIELDMVNGGSTTTYTDNNLTPLTNYSYQIYSINGPYTGDSPLTINALTLAPGEFRINESATGTQTNSSVATLGDVNGTYVVAWKDNGTSIKAQKFNADGPLSSEITVDNTGGAVYSAPSVAMAGNGSFVVTWGNNNASRSYVKRFQSNGTIEPTNGLTTLNPIGGCGQTRNPAVAIGSTGDFIVTFENGSPSSSDTNIGVRRFDNSGSELSNFFAASNGSQQELNPAIALSSNGKFVISWENPDANRSFFKRFQADGNVEPTNGETLIQPITGCGISRNPAVAMGSTGDFVVTFENVSPSGSGDLSIAARIYDNAGAETNNFFVANNTSSHELNPAITMNGTGKFTILWDTPEAGGGKGIFGKTYNSDGSLIGSQFQVNTVILGDQQRPAIAALNSSVFISTWDGNTVQDTEGIAARRLPF